MWQVATERLQLLSENTYVKEDGVWKIDIMSVGGFPMDFFGDGRTVEHRVLWGRKLQAVPQAVLRPVPAAPAVPAALPVRAVLCPRTKK